MDKGFGIIICLICFVMGNFGVALAQEYNSQDNTYKIIFDDSSSGYSGNDTRSIDQDGDNILIGGLESYDTGYGNNSSGFKFKSGLQSTFEANVAGVNVLSNDNAGVLLYDRLILEINPNGNPTSANGVRFAVQVDNDLTFASPNYVNPANFQLDLVTNSDLSIYYQPCAQSNLIADATRWDCGTVIGLVKFIEGLTPNTQYCARIIAMNGDATNSEPGPAICAVTAPLILTFTVSPNISNFGALSFTNVTTATPSTTLTSFTNAMNGYSTTVVGTGSGAGAVSGLYKSSAPNHLIASTTGNLNASIGTEGYGMQAIIASGNATLDPNWDTTLIGRNPSYVGQLLRSAVQVYSRNNPNPANDVINTIYLANISTTTQTGVYQDVLTYTMIPSY
jgi:hypothetical protein